MSNVEQIRKTERYLSMLRFRKEELLDIIEHYRKKTSTIIVRNNINIAKSNHDITCQLVNFFENRLDKLTKHGN